MYWAKVSYSIGSGKRATAYITLSAITDNNASHTKITASGNFDCSYRKGVSTSSNYYVAANDTVYLIATSGNNYQIMYPIANGQWRIAWCSKSNYDKYCSKTQTNNSATTQASSWQWPMTGYTVTQSFGNYYSARKMYHCGINMSSSKKIFMQQMVLWYIKVGMQVQVMVIMLFCHMI
ncbi:MAG: hypothetical protein IJ300_01570 [Clostridia bacterium]|nr:hypothetical protein [Clostridia bacterium]MBQ8765812.1 hypothetical protein [Clostridia bacterium]